MSEDMLMMLLRIAIIVVPASFACFIVGYIMGRNFTWRKELLESRRAARYEEPMEWQEPVHYTTRLTSRNNTLEF